ncbi:DUF317 domain-containing protein [Streptomyces chrestomyceticus]
MPVSERQLAAFADQIPRRIPLDTSPRHLAGAGDARHVTHALAAAGWDRTSDPFSPEIILGSPDGRFTLHFDPQSVTSAWWRLRAAPTGTEPGWYAEFGELVPAEIVGRLTDALTAPPPPQPPDPLQALESAGWLLSDATTAHSPDRMCHVERCPDQEDLRGFWHVETCEPGHGTLLGPRIWHARFDGQVPDHLVAAFITGLADPAPLQRGMFDRTAHHSVVQEPSPHTPEQVVAAHANRLNAIRVQARATRRQQPARPTTASPMTGAATRPAARR